MGLHVDIDRIHGDNYKKEGLRKVNKILINEGGKLSSTERYLLRKEM